MKADNLPLAAAISLVACVLALASMAGPNERALADQRLAEETAYSNGVAAGYASGYTDGLAECAGATEE